MGDTPLCPIETAENGRVLVAVLDNAPDNAVTPEMLDGLGGALDALAAPGAPDLLVLTGRGRVFSKGFDLAVIRACADSRSLRGEIWSCNAVVSRLRDCPKPTIAAINGHCFGAGLELALACHFRLCAEKARLGLPELWRGLIPGLGGIHRLVELVGRAKALELIAVGELITAEEALRVGLVNRVVSRERFQESVWAYARALLSVDQHLVREVIRLCGVAVARGDRENVAEMIESISRLLPAAKP